MLRVRLTRRLQSQIVSAQLDPHQLVADFTDWKLGLPDDNYLFGHDALGIGSRHLRHVHLVPMNDPVARGRWDRVWECGWGRRTSDRYLFYADGGHREGYLLLALIDDPGAHAIWEPRHAALRARLELIAEDFCVFGEAP